MKSRAIFQTLDSATHPPKELTIMDAIPNIEPLLREVIDLSAHVSFRKISKAAG
jgi:hypothetical protein